MTSEPRPLALITGASSGIGKAIALELTARGWDLGLVGRNAERLSETARACEGRGQTEVRTCAIDMRDGAAFADFLGQMGPPALYVSNHGILDGRRGGDLVETAEVAEEVLAINLNSSVAAIHRVLGAMRAAGGGQIVVVSSLAGLSPLPDAAAYSASKAGLVAYALSLREALRHEKIGVSVVCPGYVNTRMGGEHLGNRPHEISADDAARRILKAGLANRRLSGFPAPLWPSALFSMMMPEALTRAMTRSLRFTVRKD